MTVALYNELIVVFDVATKGILGTALSDQHANSLILGNINYRYWSLPLHFVRDDPDYQVDLNDLSNHYQLDTVKLCKPLPTKFVTEEWIRQRDLFQFKANYLQSLEQRARVTVSSTNTFFGNADMSAYIIDQLNKSRPEDNIYTEAVSVWAHEQGISEKFAYQELSNLVDYNGLCYLRCYAVWSKWSRKISFSNNKQEIDELFKQALKNFMPNV